MKTALIYATAHGQTRRVLEHSLPRLRVVPDLFTAAAVTAADQLAAYDLLLFFCPTYGLEELHPDMESFLVRVRLDLSGRHFAICELGNHLGYEKFTFGALRIIRYHLLRWGGTEWCEPLSLDAFPRVAWDHLEDWIDHLNQRLSVPAQA